MGNIADEWGMMHPHAGDSEVRSVLTFPDGFADSVWEHCVKPHKVRHAIARAVEWFGRPYVTWANLEYGTDGTLFAPDGRTYTDTSASWQNRPHLNGAHQWHGAMVDDWADLARDAKFGPRIPAPPWPGWEYVPETDPLTGWPFSRLVKTLPEGCTDCEATP